jgi:cell division protein FtsB
MAARPNVSQRWVSVYRVAWGLLAVVAVVGIGSLFYPQYAHYRELQRREEALRREYRRGQQQLKRLKHDQEGLRNDPAFVERIAREQLGFARPGETVIKFYDDDGSRSQPSGAEAGSLR